MCDISLCQSLPEGNRETYPEKPHPKKVLVHPFFKEDICNRGYLYLILTTTAARLEYATLHGITLALCFTYIAVETYFAHNS